MLYNNRVIFKDNTVLNDISNQLSSIYATSATINITASQDAIYIGSDFPFNHRYFDVSTVNSASSSVSVYLWNGNEWVAAVDVIDETSLSGATLAQSGVISWKLDQDESWNKEDSEDISDLSTLRIYGMYWAKLVFSGNLSSSTALNYVGHKFSTDLDLGGQYPDLNTTSAKSAFESGKTTWVSQELIAAEKVIVDLRYKKIVVSPNQILDWQQFTDASTHKVAEIIFTALGNDYDDRRQTAKAEYEDIMKKMDFNIDRNENTRIDPSETKTYSGTLTRR